MKENFENSVSNFEGESLDIKNEISYYLFFWPWFLLTIIISLFGSYLYIRYTPNVYNSNAQIQITKSDASSSFLASDDAYTFFGTRIEVENDISVITSQHILSEVVRRLDLQSSIKLIGTIKSKLLFKKNIPFEIKLKNLEKPQQWTLKISDQTALISNESVSFNFNINEPFENDYFYLKINDLISEDERTYVITRTSHYAATISLKRSIKALPGSDRGEVINLSISGTNHELNDAILTTLIQVYNEDRIADKRQMSKASILFIEKRLKELDNTIDSISKETIRFKLENSIFDEQIQTSDALSNNTKEKEASFSLRMQLEIAESLLNDLKNQDDFKILPANIGIVDISINELLNSYNSLLLERNGLMLSASQNSPVIQQINEQLTKLKKANIDGVNRYIENLNISLASYKKINDETMGIVAGFPEKGYNLRTFEREFKFAEDLLVFLSQKKEEASISYASVLPNLKVLSYGVSETTPLSPKPNIIYLFGLLFGFFAPFSVLSLLKLFDTKINTREDLEKGLLGISILGEVPFDENLSLVKEERSIVAESIRIIRSSMSFLINASLSQVILVTSTTKGEGKSFIAYNICKSYKALGKKVILVGADLRNPQVHNFVGTKRSNIGLSTFLNDSNFDNIDEIIFKSKSNKDIDYLLSGSIPPNPSELLMRLRFNELLEKLKLRYDIIIIDSAPLLLVSDTMPLMNLSDLVVYVSRAQYSDKNIFPFIKDVSNRKNMPPFGLLLNGLITGPNSKYSYAYRYSYKYRYSYNYKYNYGYGYGYK